MIATLYPKLKRALCLKKLRKNKNLEQSGDVFEDKVEARPPVFLARQPILRAKDWQEIIQNNQVAEALKTLPNMSEQQMALHWGRMLLTGQGLRQDMRAAFSCFQKAAASSEKGDSGAALNMMGRCYEHGWGVAMDPSAAFLCYHKAVEQGDIWALFNLADCYRKGLGCAPDAVRAAELYAKAAEKGHVKSLNMLGLCYEEGNGVEPDPHRAGELFAQGAQRGDCWACLNHARFLAARGELEQSLYWLESSLGHANTDYCQTIARLFAASPNERLRALAARADRIAQKLEPIA